MTVKKKPAWKAERDEAIEELSEVAWEKRHCDMNNYYALATEYLNRNLKP